MGDLNWATHASKGSRKGREAGIQLKGEYACVWQPYSTIAGHPNGEFRYLLAEVT